MTGGVEEEGDTNEEELTERVGWGGEEEEEEERGEKQERVSSAEQWIVSPLTRLPVFLNFLHLGLMSLAFST